MKWFKDEKILRRIFDVSVIIKGVHALLELVGGIAILFVSQEFILNLATSLTTDSLSEDPDNFFANYLMHAASQYSVSFQHAAAFYLISHGIVVGFLVIGLLMKKLWSYPITIAVLGFFIFYQTYEFFIHYSWWIAAVTIFDIAIIFLTLHEYEYIKSLKQKSTP